jgi:hypothetical protein
MQWWEAGLWALAGGFVVEGLEFSTVRRRHRQWPWQVDAAASESNVDSTSSAAGPLGYFIGEFIRLAAGSVLGAAMAGSVSAPLPALAVGAAAPIIAGNLASLIPMSQPIAGGKPVAASALSQDVIDSCPPQQRPQPGQQFKAAGHEDNPESFVERGSPR